MKNVLKTFKKYSLYGGMLSLALGFTSCSDDDDGNIIIPDNDASITAEAQFVTDNTITISNVVVDDDSWIVVRKVEDDASYSDFIAEPEYIEEGTHTNIVITLDNTNATDVTLEDGDEIIVMLHEDDDDGVFEFDNNTGPDELITDANGSAINATFALTAPNFSIDDQSVAENSITFSNVNTEEDVWIVVHNEDAEGEIDESEIIGWALVPAGDNTDVVVTFDDIFIPTPGQNLWARVHLDDPADQEFTFLDDPATDMPAHFGFDNDGTITGSFVLN